MPVAQPPPVTISRSSATCRIVRFNLEFAGNVIISATLDILDKINGAATARNVRSVVNPGALQLSLLEGFGRILAEREGFEPSVQVLARTTV